MIAARLPERGFAYHSLFHVSQVLYLSCFIFPSGSRQELREVKTTALGRVSLPAAAQGGAVQALALVGPVEPVPALVLRRQELGRARQG